MLYNYAVMLFVPKMPYYAVYWSRICFCFVFSSSFFTGILQEKNVFDINFVLLCSFLYLCMD